MTVNCESFLVHVLQVADFESTPATSGTPEIREI